MADRRTDRHTMTAYTALAYSVARQKCYIDGLVRRLGVVRMLYAAAVACARPSL